MFQQIFLDMDGVIADFDAGVRRWFNINWHPTEWSIDYEGVFHLTQEEFWNTLDNEFFWKTMPLTHYCKSILSVVAPFKPCILSAAVVPAAFAGKLKWLEEYYAEAVDEDRWLFSTHRSKSYCARPGTILIDDNETNCMQWEKHGGTAILWPQPYNSYGGIVKYPMEYLMSSLMSAMGGK